MNKNIPWTYLSIYFKLDKKQRETFLLYFDNIIDRDNFYI